MKRALICLVALLFGGLSLAGAQDLLVRRDGQRLKVLVTEISPETVRYKRFTNPDGRSCYPDSGSRSGCAGGWPAAGAAVATGAPTSTGASAATTAGAGLRRAHGAQLPAG